MSSSTPSLPEKSNIPQNSPSLHELIPVFAKKHPTFKWFCDHFARQDPNNKQPAIDQNDGVIRLTRSLLMADYLTSGQRDDYENLVACQESDRLSYETFRRLSQQLGIFLLRPDLYDLLELYIIISHLSDTEIVNGLVCRIPRDQLDCSKFGLPYVLISNGLIPEADNLNLAELDTLRRAFKYAAKVEQAFLKGEKITFNQDFSDSEQRIVYAGAICDLAAIFVPTTSVSGSLTLNESLALYFLASLNNRNDPGYIGYLCQVSQQHPL